MDQMYTSMMLMNQVVPERQAASADQSTKSETSFRDLLEKQQTAEQEPEVESSDTQAPKAEETAVAEQKPETEEEIVVPEQLLAAAMVAMQKPVVVLEQVTAPVHSDVAVVQSVVQEGQVVNAAMPEGAVVESPVAEGQEVVDMKVPQMADTPVQTMEPEVQANPNDQPMQAEAESSQGKPLEAEGKDAVVETDADPETAVFRDVKEVLVKVGETAETETTKMAASVKEQVSDRITTALNQGESRITIQLNPQNLGLVEVEMTLTKDGTLHVALHADNRLTQQLLEKESLGLQSVLTRHTQQDVQVEVPRQQESQQQNFEDDRQNGHQHNPRQQKEQKQGGNDFLHQLRLGLVPLDAEAV